MELKHIVKRAVRRWAEKIAPTRQSQASLPLRPLTRDFLHPPAYRPLYDLFQFHVLRFYGKVRGPHGEGCTFVHISARFRRFVYVPELLRAVRSSKRQDSRRPQHPMPSSLHTFSRISLSCFRILHNPFKTNRIHPEFPIFHLSAHVRDKLSRVPLSVWRTSENHSAEIEKSLA